MRIIRLFAATLFIAAIAAIPAFAQRSGAAPTTPAATAPAQTGPTGPVPSSKIAYVDTEAFSDEKTGITRYVAALNNLQREFQPRQTELQNLANRIKAIADEIQKTGSVSDPKALQDKQSEGERLQRELEYKKKEYDAAVAKRYDEVVGPISQDIGNALIAFAKQRGITMTFDISKLAGAILTLDRSMDITTEFVKEYNSKNPATASTAAPGR
ncbi:MAG: OmpH family outer membrane protein [Acidobacteria bacterium]|nr:OmpH family outer membrane protein [Acidobacteriota bacterium]